MRFLIFLISFFLASDALASFSESCKYGHENVIGLATVVGIDGGCNLPDSYFDRFGDMVINVESYRDSSNRLMCTITGVAPQDCANTPNDDTGESGCYGKDVVSEDGLGNCGQPVQECSGPGGSTYTVPSTAQCSDFCTGGPGAGAVNRCSGQPGEDPLDEPDSPDDGPTDDDWADDHCQDLLGAHPGWSCSQDPNDSGCVNYGSNGIEFKSCRGDDNDNSDGDNGSDPGNGDNNDGSDSDGDGIPDDCMYEYNAALDDCPVNLPGWTLTLVSAQECTYQCNPPSTDPNDGVDDNPDPGDSDGDPDPDPDPQPGNGGGDPDPDPQPGNGGSDPDDEPTGDPMGIDGFESLEERVDAKRTEYMEKLDEYRGKFNELFDFNPGSGGSPFYDDNVIVMGVEINFGTSRFEPFLAFLPALILFAATCYAAFLVMSGGSK